MFQISQLNIAELVAIDFNELNLSKLKKDFDNISSEKSSKIFYLMNLNNIDLLKKTLKNIVLILFFMQLLINTWMSLRLTLSKL